MKAIFSLLILAVTFLSLGISSCSKDSDSSSTTQETIQTSVQSGTWKITKFIDSGDDETNSFSSYTFTFAGNGTISATNGSDSFNGNWSISDSNSNDDSQSDLHFIISFNLSNSFEDLNDDWNFVSHSSSKIELTDVSGGNGGTDYLTFSKN